MKLFKTPLQAAIFLYLVGLFIVFGNMYFAAQHFKSGDMTMLLIDIIAACCGVPVIVQSFKFIKKHY